MIDRSRKRRRTSSTCTGWSWTADVLKRTQKAHMRKHQQRKHCRSVGGSAGDFIDPPVNTRCASTHAGFRVQQHPQLQGSQNVLGAANEWNRIF